MTDDRTNEQDIPDGGAGAHETTEPETGFDDARTVGNGSGTDAEDELLRTHAIQTDTTDSVAGETVLPGLGDGNDGPTGGAPREPEPGYAENDLAGEEIDLDDEE